VKEDERNPTRVVEPLFGKSQLRCSSFQRQPACTGGVAKRKLRWLLMLLQLVILRMNHGSSSTVSLQPEDVLLQWRLHNSPPSQAQRKKSITICRTTAIGWFCETSTIVFYFHSFMNYITTLFFTVPIIITVIHMPTARILESIHSNRQFWQVFIVLHTWRTV